MKGTQAAGRYALSLIEFALEKNILEAVKQDMELVGRTIAENRDLELLLQSPIIKSDKKQKVLASVFDKSVQYLTKSFILMVCAKGREAILPAIVEAYITIYKERLGIVTAQVTSAVALTEAQRKEVIGVLSGLGKEIELDERVDSHLLGGLKVRVGDQLVDASTRKKLNELKYDIHNS